MKRLILATIMALTVSACSDGSGSGRPLYPYHGSWSFTGRFCDTVLGKFNCVEALTPAACAGHTLFSATTIDYYGENIMIDGQNHPLTSSGNDLTVSDTGQTFSVRLDLDLDAGIFKFAPGCELEMERQ